MIDKSDFDEVAYLNANVDVAEAVKSGEFSSGWEHYCCFGRNENRLLKSQQKMSRQDKVLSVLDMQGLGLEIGPSHNPIAPKAQGYNVHILDHLDQKELKKKYAKHHDIGVNIERIEPVDFVWNGQSFAELIGQKECYDWIIASHVIEHVPDLINFMQECTTLLKSGGRLSLAIPDKRYCFDHLRTLSTTGDVLDAHQQKRIRPSPGQIFDYFSSVCKKGEQIAWSSNTKGDITLIHDFEETRHFWQKALEDKEYIDVHCWRFVPESFELIVKTLQQLGLINLCIAHQFDTCDHEFFVVLEKTTSSNPFDANERLATLCKIL